MPRAMPQSALRLSLPEREEISRGLLAGEAAPPSLVLELNWMSALKK